MVKHHQQTRKLLADKQAKRQAQKHNEVEAYQAYLLDQTEKDTINFRQLKERSTLQNKVDILNAEQQKEITEL